MDLLSANGRWVGNLLQGKPGQSGPNRHGIPFSRLAFVVRKYSHYLIANLPYERLYYEIKLAWLDGPFMKKLLTSPNADRLKKSQETVSEILQNW